MFFFKKLVGAFASPLAFAFLLALVAVILHWRRKPRAAAWVLIAMAALVYAGSISPVGDALLRPLERKYAPLQENSVPAAVQHVVVLGSNYWPRRQVPITGALGHEGVVRAVEGIRLQRKLGLRHLVLSGGAAMSPAPSAEGYAVLARSLGVDPSTIIVLDQPQDTAEEAVAVKQLLGDAPFILVTSAYHMPRAMRLMEGVGAHPIPAPTGQRARDIDGILWTSWIPNAGYLDNTDDALHEYLGLLAMAIGIQ